MRIGLNVKVGNIIRNMCYCTGSIVTLVDLETEWMRSRRGYRGVYCPITVWLIYRGNSTGSERVWPGNKKLGILLCANYGILLGESFEDLQKMLDIVTRYRRDFSVNFNIGKS